MEYKIDDLIKNELVQNIIKKQIQTSRLYMRPLPDCSG